MAGPYTEDERIYLEIVNQFLGKADSQALHQEIKGLRETVAAGDGRMSEIRQVTTGIQKDIHAGSLANAELQRDVQQSRQANAELQGDLQQIKLAISELQKENQQLQTANQTLQANLGEARGAKSKLEGKYDDLQRTCDAITGVNANMRASIEGLQSAVKDLHDCILQDGREAQKTRDRTAQVEARLDEHESVIDHVAKRFIRDGPVGWSDERDVEAWAQDLAPPELWDHQDPQRAAQRVGHPFVPQNGGLPESRPQASHRPDSQQLRVVPSGSQQQRSTDRNPAEPVSERTTRANKAAARQETANDSDGGASPRLLVIKEHYTATKRKFDAAPPKDQRRFVWAFIEGCKDKEFSAWFQELLLRELPNEMIHRAKGPRGRLVALTMKVTWEAVRKVIKELDVPAFLR